MEKEESGVRRTVWLPIELDTKVEEARKLLGLGRSSFYRFAIIETLKSIIITDSKRQLKEV
ncbi:MAG: hypothetical protein QXH37_02100 [Candidatus Bathyarchaeia archaeon]